MIISCLDDYIGIPGCSSEDPASGLWINDHPGLSLASFDKIADSDKQNWFQVWDTVQRRAQARFVSDVVSSFSKKYRLRKVTDTVVLPRQRDNTILTAGGGDPRGLSIELAEGRECACSFLQVIHIQELEYYATTGQNNLTFSVYDVTQNTLLETVTKNVNVGRNVIMQNKHYPYLHIYILFNPDTSTPDLQLDNNCDESCGCCEGCCGHCFGTCCKGVIKGVRVGSTVTEGTNTFGLSGRVSVHCSFESVICTNLYLFRNAYWYLLGYEALRERVFTERLNRFTTVDRKIAKEEMLPEFWDNYIRELTQVTDGIDLSDGCCLECDGLVHYQATTI